ncbi:hypothetical protein O5706_20355 [Escherichia coli]|uniref:hypothetical protein n=1 Tax=Escherichia coli TaxID=562 RepID=UPI00207C5A91|nr:hypothetical protein [Escherichia coli]MCZ5349476.1 hypothetical protein [Escherichia coli]MCZ5621099.1 hypothetical protein [Escherichia coli]MCZ5776043.1 hypothetical protein [Escherichia coli]MCZ6219981.1 hypothetical protein [Escherichia coli]
MRYLYLLNMIALELREDTRIKVEVGHWYRMTGKRLSLNVPPFMLIPRNIRRKVDGFRQSEGEATKQTAQPFTGSLYEVLSRDIDSAKLINYIEEFCNKMTEKYLISAARRHYQKKKIARSRSGES